MKKELNFSQNLVCIQKKDFNFIPKLKTNHMEKIKNSFLSILLISPFTLFYSCNNESSDILTGNTDEKRILTDEQIRSIGELHNQTLELAFNDFNWSTNDMEKEFIDKFNDLEIAKENNLKFKKAHSLETNLVYIQQNLKERKNFQFFERTINYLNANDVSVTKIEDFMKKLELEMKESNSSVRDYESFLVFSSVIQHSAKFWLPVKKGGFGNYDKFKTLENRNFQSSGNSAEFETSSSCSKNVLAADAASAGAGCLFAAIYTGASGGVLAPLAFAQIATEAGFSSGMAYFSC
ncbi:MAG: hypothetical protein LBT29_07950 [Flavobacteriaceae bacterium]|jgi:hypothetical protein|nr:hypothetical protein [Flavobacteriaceae bacterium]